jgi:hypothetical protein
MVGAPGFDLGLGFCEGPNRSPLSSILVGLLALSSALVVALHRSQWRR